MSLRIGINGFGRIGRTVFRLLIGDHPQLPVVAINDLAPADRLANLLFFDSNYGVFSQPVDCFGNELIVGSKRVAVLRHPRPADVPWSDHGVEVVVESSGRFTNRAGGGHLGGSVRKVIITAPANDADVILIYGVNHASYSPIRHNLISCGSCTTNCLAPMVAVLDDHFGLAGGLFTTIHAVTGDQRLVDADHRDPFRARAALNNIIPTSTGAAATIGLVLPELAGRLTGLAVRVPVATVSLLDLTAQLDCPAAADEISTAFREAAGEPGSLAQIMAVTDEPMVGLDFRGCPYSCVIAANLIAALPNQRTVKVLGWYDNEWGYCCRVIDLLNHLDRVGLPGN